MILSLVKGKQDHLRSNHAYLCIPGIFGQYILLVKIAPKGLEYQLSFWTKRQHFLNTELLWVCITFSRAKRPKSNISKCSVFFLMEWLRKARGVCFQIAVIFGLSHFISFGSFHVIMIQFCSLWNLWQHSH